MMPAGSWPTDKRLMTSSEKKLSFVSRNNAARWLMILACSFLQKKLKRLLTSLRKMLSFF
jgi:hypothetical protein